MDFHIWVVFVVAASVVLVVPGPTVVFVVAKVTDLGIRRSFPVACGVLAGDLVCMSLSLVGVGLVLSTSAVAFSIVKWLGIAYLVYLGVDIMVKTRLRHTTAAEKTEHEGVNESRESSRSLFFNAFLLNTLHPKGMIFYSSFMPQFISGEKAASFQFLTMGLTFLCLAAVNLLIYMAMAMHLKRLKGSGRFRSGTLVKYVSGVILIATGVCAAVM
ncbi:LysE family translocator [Desulfoluna spongiiphila]|uniref:Threonine/homoserine/homoserine lactone efflux protein n=1 Tax=Desulfoluna spongiiphila TaxID=419481 RepID=A0A1G5F3Z4_9BACT|nr:LysE family translocator [Desulfoluna spongiiphila]SCY33975.1 Threonine/homoserine/homoserine lactone efflux protein [Desulfoluna spongiiphila]